MKCRFAGETEVLGENLPQRHFCPSQNPTWPDPGLNPGCRGGRPVINRLSYGAATTSTVVLLVVGGDEKGSQCPWGCNWANLSLGDINVGT
jgi:hypothetical protein